MYNIHMKHYATKFEEYIISQKKNNLHSNLINNIKLPKYIKQLNNIILYGPPGIGKYSLALYIINHYSNSNLKYERKINIMFNKKEYIFKVSDTHIEIDMSLLGCNAKTLFNQIFYHILHIFSANENKSGIILCKNFNNIHNELLGIFYSYMQNNLNNINTDIKFIIISEHLSFIPNNIINRCNILSIKQPSKTKYNNLISKKIINKHNIYNISNIKDLKSNFININDKFSFLCHKIIEYIDNYQELEFIGLRDSLYDLCINNFDILDVLYYIISYYINKRHIKFNNIENIILHLDKSITLYNNNYRPIFHLEKIIYNLIIEIHGL